MKYLTFSKRLSAIALSAVLLSSAVYPTSSYSNPITAGYRASQEGIKGVFDALSSAMRKPVILSKAAERKKVTGNFDFTNPMNTLKDLSDQLGLIWYDNGQAIYVYDASELRNAVVALRNTSFPVVRDFLIQSGVYDQRFPLRADSRNTTFYVSGPPSYVETITSSAKFLDEKSDGFDGRENVAVIPLHNTFVEDRHYKFRNDNIVIPGVATVLSQLLGGSGLGGNVQISPLSEPAAEAPTMPAFPGVLPNRSSGPVVSLETAVKSRPTHAGLSIIADPGTNSVLVRGSAEQVSYVRNIISGLDVSKRHIELSVYIIDLQKEALDQLGVRWSGNVTTGDSFGVAFNGGSSTIDGASFMADVMALSSQNKANVVSRPMVLTQENIPAVFDNNRTFYTRLIGERSVELQNVTYGTSISVLPRFTQAGEIEMMLNVEDGNQMGHEVDSMPEVGRTNISTIARVPRNKSLLIGGYTRDESSTVQGKVPLLGDIPLVGGLFRYSVERQSNMVRVFLIQPREITSPLGKDAHTLAGELRNDLSNPDLHNWMSNYMESTRR